MEDGTRTKMEVTSTNLHPVEYHKRRNSYITAIEESNAFILESHEITQHCNVEENWNNQKEKLTNITSHESGNSSQSSLCARKKCNSTMSTPPSTSRMSSMQEIERQHFSCSSPSELTSSVLQYQQLIKNIGTSHCKCREDSLLSAKDSSSITVSAAKYHDSGYSLSTCQSLIIPSSVTNSTNHIIPSTNERRHSDVTHSRRHHHNTDQRRLSDQSVVKPYHCNDSQMYSLSTTISLPCSLLPKDNTKCSKLLDRRNATSFKHMRNLTRQNSDVSIRSFHRDSNGPMTDRMMKRRFSEQLILEGGLTYEPEFEELVEGDDLEESLTGIIARKKVTLKSHYYPEGHWGYIITIVAVIIQLICHGLQVASGVLLNSCAIHFDTSIIDTDADGRYFSFANDAESPQRLKQTASRQTESADRYEGRNNHDYYYPNHVEPSFLENLHATKRDNPTGNSEGSVDYFSGYPSDIQPHERLELHANSQSESPSHIGRNYYPADEYSRIAEFSHIPKPSSTEENESAERSEESNNYFKEYSNTIGSSVTSGENNFERSGLTEYLPEFGNLPDADLSEESSRQSQTDDTTQDTGSAKHSEESTNHFAEYSGPAALQGKSEIHVHDLTESAEGLDKDVDEYSNERESLSTRDVIDTEGTKSTEIPHPPDNDVSEYPGSTASEKESEDGIVEKTKSIESSEESNNDIEEYPNITESSPTPGAISEDKTGLEEEPKVHENYDEGDSDIKVSEEKLEEIIEDQIESNEHLDGSNDGVQKHPAITEPPQASETITTQETVATEYCEDPENDEQQTSNPASEQKLEAPNAQPELSGRTGRSYNDDEDHSSITESSRIPEAVDTEGNVTTAYSNISGRDVKDPSSITATETNSREAINERPQLSEHLVESNDKVNPRITDASEISKAIDTEVTGTAECSDKSNSHVPALVKNHGNNMNPETRFAGGADSSDDYVENHPCYGDHSVITETDVIERVGSKEHSDVSESHANECLSNTPSCNALKEMINQKIASTERSEEASTHIDGFPSDITATLLESPNDNQDVQSDFAETPNEHPPDLINDGFNASPMLTDAIAVPPENSIKLNAHQAQCPTALLNEDQIALICPTGFRRHSKYCNLFYQCTTSRGFHYEVTTFSCPIDTAFDDQRIQCLPLDKLTIPCPNQKLYNQLRDNYLKTIPVDDTCLCPGVGHYPHQHHLCSTSFYKCKLRNEGSLEGYYHHCPPGYVYWPASRRCQELKYFPACENK